VAVVDAFESGIVDLPDYYFTGNDYRYRFETEAKRCFLSLLRQRFNVGVRWNSRILKWDTVIEQKAAELGHCLLSRSSKLDFSEPSPTLLRSGDRELRKRILKLTQSDARRLGIGKSTLHYLRYNARGERAFKISREVLARLER
jgi:CRISPR-associated protein Cas1